MLRLAIRHDEPDGKTKAIVKIVDTYGIVGAAGVVKQEIEVLPGEEKYIDLDLRARLEMEEVILPEPDPVVVEPQE